MSETKGIYTIATENPTIRQKQHKGFLYFDGLNTFVLCYGIKYLADGEKRCDLLGIQECTIKSFDLDFSELPNSDYDIATNIPPDNVLYRYVKSILPIKSAIATDDLDKLYYNFLGCILTGKLGVSSKIVQKLDDMIKLSKQDDKIVYNSVLLGASYFADYAQVSSFFDR
jgi:hypothetical protein